MKLSYRELIFLGMAFITANDFLVTEKSGELYRVSAGTKTAVTGLPDIYVRGQGGFTDVALHPEFTTNNTLYFYCRTNIEGDSSGNTALYSTVLNGTQLEAVKLLYKATPNTKKGQHWGSRIVFDGKGHLFFGVGDRSNRDVNPQDLGRDGGKIYCLNLMDPSQKTIHLLMKKEPKKQFILTDIAILGMTLHPETGALWETEHGPRGGDEINIISPGKNYGWPKITYGINYSGTLITDDTALPGMEQPFTIGYPLLPLAA